MYYFAFNFQILEIEGGAGGLIFVKILMGIESMRIDAILMNVGKTDYSIQTCFSLSYNFIYHDLINAHVDFLQELLSYT